MKYKAILTINYELETDKEYDDILNDINKDLEEVLKNKLALKSSLKLEKLKEKNSTIKLKEFLIDEVLPFSGKEQPKRIYVVDGVEYSVRMNTVRYLVFQQSLSCASCGITGIRMFLEKNPSDKTPHFNLYAMEDGCLVLMTKDHIVAKSVGGQDNMENLISMCQICNNLKSHYYMEHEQIHYLRKIWNINKNKLSKKKFFELISENRNEIIKANQGKILTN